MELSEIAVFLIIVVSWTFLTNIINYGVQQLFPDEKMAVVFQLLAFIGIVYVVWKGKVKDIFK